MLRKILVTLGAISPVTSAMTQPVAAVAPLSHSGQLKVTSTAPIRSNCPRSGVDCFRVVINVAAGGGGEIGVMAVSENGSELHEGTAVLESGVVCGGWKLGGLPLVESWYDMSLHPHGDPVIVSAQSPGRIVAEYRCDGRLVPGEQVSWSLVLATASERGEFTKGVYTFPDTALRAAPR